MPSRRPAAAARRESRPRVGRASRRPCRASRPAVRTTGGVLRKLTLVRRSVTPAGRRGWRAGRPPYPRPRVAASFATTLLLFLCLFAASARADLVVVQRVEGGGMEGEMTIRIQGKKVRADIAPGISTIVDGDKGETIVLQHKTKIFNRITAEQTKALAEQLLLAQAGSTPPKLTLAKEKKEVAGHQTQAYLWV